MTIDPRPPTADATVAGTRELIPSTCGEGPSRRSASRAHRGAPTGRRRGGREAVRFPWPHHRSAGTIRASRGFHEQRSQNLINGWASRCGTSPRSTRSPARARSAVRPSGSATRSRPSASRSPRSRGSSARRSSSVPAGRGRCLSPRPGSCSSGTQRRSSRGSTPRGPTSRPCARVRRERFAWRPTSRSARASSPASCAASSPTGRGSSSGSRSRRPTPSSTPRSSRGRSTSRSAAPRSPTGRSRRWS